MKPGGKVTCLFILVLVTLGTLTGAAEATEYILGPGDVIAVDVWGHPDLQIQAATVLPDGSISFPLVGKVTVAGRTVEEVQKLLEEELSLQLVSPRVTVMVVAVRKISVTITGQVNRPGIYEMTPGSRAGDAVTTAGGPTGRAELGKVMISSADGREEIRVELGEGYNFHSRAAVGPELEDGMTIFVPERTRLIEIKVLGRVNRPGVYEVEEGVLAVDAIAAAGGPTGRAELDKVVISSPETGLETEVNLGKRDRFHNEPAVGPVLADGDTVFVPETSVPDPEKVYRYLTIITAVIGILSL